MRLPRGVVRKGSRYFARIHTKGGERSFPLGSDPSGAVAAFYRVKAAILAGKDPRAPEPEKPEPELTVARATKRWLAEQIDPVHRPENAATIRSRVESSLVAFIGARPLRSIRRADCHAYKSHLRVTRPKLKPGTLLHYLRDLRELLNWAEDVELIVESPWPRRDFMPKSKRRPPDRLTDAEVLKLVSLPDPLGFNLRLAIGTGCRWGELCRLQRTDLLPDGSLLIREAKDGEPRTVPVPPQLLVEIVRRRGPLFFTKRGRPWSENSNGSFNAKVADLTGIKRFHIHETRHTFACRYLEAGGELAMLQEILGHASVVTTQRYGRPNAKAIRGDAARVFAAWEDADREENRELGQKSAQA
jgi:integrase